MSLYCFYFHKNKVGLKAFILLIISCLIYLGIRAKYKLAGTYVAIDLNVTEYINRLLWYIQYHPDIFILGIISTISCIYCWLSDKKSIMFAMLLVCNLTGWAYIVAICLWRMCLSYYLYPAVTFFAISFSSISGFQDHRKFKRAIASLMIIPLFYGVSYNYKVAVSHIDLGNVYTQSLESLLKHTKENDRVLCENWYFYEEPITQTNILLNHYSHPLNLYGIAQELLNGFNGIQWKDIALFGYSREDYESLKKEFIPREGDYLLVYLNDRSFRGPVRAVNPASSPFQDKSYYTILQNDALEVIDKTVIHSKWIPFPGANENGTATAGYLLYRVTGEIISVEGQYADGWTEKIITMSNISEGKEIVVDIAQTAALLMGENSDIMSIVLNGVPIAQVDIGPGSCQVKLNDYVESIHEDDVIQLIFEKVCIPSNYGVEDSRVLGVVMNIIIN